MEPPHPGGGGLRGPGPVRPPGPLETCILPTRHRPHYDETDGPDFASLGRLLSHVLRRLDTVLVRPSYNFMLHSAPLRTAGRELFHWHLEILPKLTRVAGFEWGTGFFINPTPPEVAARFLRDGRPAAVSS